MVGPQKWEKSIIYDIHREEGLDGDWDLGCINYVQGKEHPIIM